MDKKTFIEGIAVGAVAGAIAGLLLAPKSGQETREEITADLNEIKDKLVARLEKLEDCTKEKYDEAVAAIVAEPIRLHDPALTHEELGARVAARVVQGGARRAELVVEVMYLVVLHLAYVAVLGLDGLPVLGVVDVALDEVTPIRPARGQHVRSGEDRLLAQRSDPGAGEHCLVAFDAIRMEAADPLAGLVVQGRSQGQRRSHRIHDMCFGRAHAISESASGIALRDQLAASPPFPERRR